MSKLKTLQRRNAILGGLVVVLLAGVILLSPGSGATTTDALPLLFPGFKGDLARRIEIVEPATEQGQPPKRLILARQGDGRWVAENRSGYPIKPSGETRLLDNIEIMRKRKLVTTREETFDKYAPSIGWRQIRVIGEGNKELVSFSLGKSAQPYPEVFVLTSVNDKPTVLQALNVTADMASPDIDSWVDARLWPDLLSDQMIRVDLEQPEDKSRIVIAKRGEAPADIEVGVPEKDKDGKLVWWMVEPKEGDADTDRTENLARAFTGLRLEDVVAESDNAETLTKYGLDKPRAKVRIYFKGAKDVIQHEILIGGKNAAGTAFYVKRGKSSWVFQVPAYNLTEFLSDAQTFQKAEEVPDEGTEPPDFDDPDGNPGDGEPEDGGGEPPTEPAPVPAPVPPSDDK
ncbi:MAG: DUF4340 domain-containing protein [bacterium]|nr:DUF4340 domain-containing protein [bacterium]